MAASVNRSPSPLSTRPNPNSRTPEANSTMRRSYSGNPFTKPSNLSNPRSFPPVTPANSPAADLGGRHSISKEIGFSSRAYEEKENEKDQNLKPVKVRSPAILKGAKNFMTPTISAASKVTASPKKKVLVERNEPARTSISFSDGNSPFGSMNNSNFKEDVDAKDSTIKQKDESLISQVPLHSQNFSESYTNMKSVESDVGFNQNKAEDSNNSAIRKSKKVSFVDSQAPLNSQIFSESIFDVKPVESDLTSVDNDCKIKPFGSSISPIIAPLDADPSRPYDPKTNYLSPRPQFLHYKPNPRIEVYLHKEKGIGSTEQGKILEESFISESFSDTEVTSEEIESENSNKESEDDSSVEFVNEEVDPHVSEPKPTNICKETVEDKGVLKTKFFKRSKSVALILVLLIACLSVSVKESPVLDLSSYKDLSIFKFYDPSEIAGFSKASFNGFARNLKQWSANSGFYLSKLISSLDEVHRLGPLQFRNLTSLLEEDPFIDGYLKVDHSDVINEEIDEQEGEVAVELLLEETLDNGAPDEVADDNEEALEGLDIEEEHLTLETEENESDCSELGVNQEQSDIPSLPSNGPESDCSELGVNQEQIDTPSLPSNGPESDCSELGVIQEQIDIPSLPSNGPEFEPEVVETREINSEILDTGEVQDAEIESTAAEAISKSHLEMDTPLGNVASSESVVNWSEIKFFLHHKQTIATLALGLALVAAAIAIAVVYLKPRGTTTPSAEVIDPLMTKKQIISTPPSQIWPADVDVVGESCPSEMSSFQKSMSYSKRVVTGENEIQSQEKKQRKTSKRRESLASSSDYSMGSPSYGSFTTYEKIPTKHASGEEEIVTPVRRSSRFKNQVTSP